MRRLLFIVLLMVAIIFVAQIIYFVFFHVRVIRYNEGQPLNSVSVAVHIHNISALHYDGNNNVWIGTEKQCIYRFDVTKKRITTGFRTQ
jgi:hypothetical protein